MMRVPVAVASVWRWAQPYMPSGIAAPLDHAKGQLCYSAPSANLSSVTFSSLAYQGPKVNRLCRSGGEGLGYPGIPRLGHEALAHFPDPMDAALQADEESRLPACGPSEQGGGVNPRLAIKRGRGDAPQRPPPGPVLTATLPAVPSPRAGGAACPLRPCGQGD
jgi:hypothetical protein